MAAPKPSPPPPPPPTPPPPTAEELAADAARKKKAKARKKQKKKRGKARKARAAIKAARNVHFGTCTVHEHWRAKVWEASGVPDPGGWPLALGDACPGEAWTATVDEYAALRAAALRARFDGLSHKKQRTATMETRPFDYKAGAENPLFAPVAERDRKALLLDSYSEQRRRLEEEAAGGGGGEGGGEGGSSGSDCEGGGGGGGGRGNRPRAGSWQPPGGGGGGRQRASGRNLRQRSWSSASAASCASAASAGSAGSSASGSRRGVPDESPATRRSRRLSMKASDQDHIYRLHKELEALRASRHANAGCGCRACPKLKKMSVKRLKQELHDRGLDASCAGLKKKQQRAALADRLAAALKASGGALHRCGKQCPCRAAGLECFVYCACSCADCGNPAGYRRFSSKSIRKHVADTIARTKAAGAGLFVDAPAAAEEAAAAAAAAAARKAAAAAVASTKPAASPVKARARIGSTSSSRAPPFSPVSTRKKAPAAVRNPAPSPVAAPASARRKEAPAPAAPAEDVDDEPAAAAEAEAEEGLLGKAASWLAGAFASAGMKDVGEDED